jgi:hypothetical protein
MLYTVWSLLCPVLLQSERNVGYGNVTFDVTRYQFSWIEFTVIRQQRNCICWCLYLCCVINQSCVTEFAPTLLSFQYCAQTRSVRHVRTSTFRYNVVATRSACRYGTGRYYCTLSLKSGEDTPEPLSKKKVTGPFFVAVCEFWLRQVRTTVFKTRFFATVRSSKPSSFPSEIVERSGRIRQKCFFFFTFRCRVSPTCKMILTYWIGSKWPNMVWNFYFDFEVSNV